MLRLVFLLIAIVLSILPAVASAAPAHNRPAPRWHGYGFLPGYHQPPNNSLPAYARKNEFAHGASQPAPLVYRSSPEFLRVRWRLALFRPAWLLRWSLQWRQLGPCWTRTPIGPMELWLIKLSLKDRARVHPFADGSWRKADIRPCAELGYSSNRSEVRDLEKSRRLPITTGRELFFTARIGFCMTALWWQAGVIYQIYPRLLSGHQRRRHRRPHRDRAAARISCQPWGRRDLDLPHLPVADG